MAAPKKLKMPIERNCIVCGSGFSSYRKQKYCSHRCIKKRWRIDNPLSSRVEYNKRRNEARRVKEKKISDKQKWVAAFEEKVKPFHPRSYKSVAIKITSLAESRKNGMVTRSRKMGVTCTITVEEIRRMMYESYGKPCPYFPERILTVENMVLDHVVPISKGGESSRTNIRPISRFANNVKGSMTEKSFLILLDWLKTQDSELFKDITTRLAGGLR